MISRNRKDLKLFQGYLKSRFWGIFLPALFFSATLFYFAPATVYFTNLQGFPLRFSYLQTHFLVITITMTLLITAAVLTLREFVSQIIVVLLVSIATLLWAQGNILIGRGYGLLDGNPLPWDRLFLRNLGELCLWFFIIRLAFSRPRAMLRISSRISIMFLLIQLISLSYLVGQGVPIAVSKKYTRDDSSQFCFSRKKNVILLVLDAFQTDVFQEMIDEKHYSINNFDGFTYFRNALGGYPTTRPSIALILTGKYYDNSIPFQRFMQEAYLSESSLTKKLKEDSFEVNLYGVDPGTIYLDPQVISNIGQETNIKNIYSHLCFIYDIALFRYTPYPVKIYIYRDQRWFLKSLYDTIINSISKGRGRDIKKSLLKKQQSIEDDIDFMDELTIRANVNITKNLFYFHHLLAVHVPFVRNEHLLYEELPNNRDGYKKQAKGTMLLVENFLKTLQKLGIYDNSMILIIADHGFGFKIAVPEKLKMQNSSTVPNVSPEVKAKALPLVLIKPFYTRGSLRISDSPVSLSDIPITIASALNIKGEFLGRGMYDIEPSDTRTRRYLSYIWKDEHWWQKGLPVMEEYAVKGFSWDDASWMKTGREFKFNVE